MASETIRERGFDAPDVAIPGSFATGTIIDVGKELLVPTNGGEELGCYLVFRFEIVRERVGVADVRNLKAGEEDFAPKLPVTPLVTDILGESDLIVITDA